ncbi:MAG: thioredoxin family protein [Saprospiraceae bacterium]|nr:thioredoxin family protein [Saprospiraceae bacterium]
MKKILIFTLFLPVFLSGQVTLRGKVNKLAPTAIQVALVEYWNVDHWQQLGILQLDNGAFIQTVQPKLQGQCRIRLAGQNKSWADFVIAPAEKGDTLLVFDLDATAMNGGPALVQGSAENDRYFKLMTAYQNLNKLRDSTSRATPEQIQAAELALNQVCRETATTYKGTFCGDIVANLLYQPQKQDYPKDAKASANEFAIAHELDKIIFQYEGNLYHNAFMKALNRYYNFFDHSQVEGSKQCIDAVMGRRNGNQAVDLFLFKYLLDKALEHMNEGAMYHLLTWYPPDCSDESPLPDATKNLIEALKNCEPGKQAPDLQLPGLNGSAVSLNDVCAKNKMTLLLFWKSNCSHCKEFEPVLAELYKKYHSQGLEVYAMSLDKVESGWKDFLQAHPTEWINTYIPQPQRKQINLQFPVPSTPTVIALDRQRKILSRLVLRDHLESYLTETLPKLADK